MIKKDAKKICIVVMSLGNGGAERSSALLSEMLFDLGMEVHIVSVMDNIKYPYKGTLFNLGELKDESNALLGRLKRLRLFKKYLRKHQFDYLIDNRTRVGVIKEFVLSRFVYQPKTTIYCVRSFHTDNYIHPNKTISRFLYKDAFKIVAVSEGISKKLRKDFGFKNLEVIHNPVKIHKQPLKIEANKDSDYILFYGRLVDSIKNISLLLRSYAASVLPSKGIRLKIMGSGEDEKLLRAKTTTLDLENMVDFSEFNPNPERLIKMAFATVLTSKYEGFPRALIESLALGTPVVSVDCQSGPSEIVTDGINGLLVENYDVATLATAMDTMLNDKDLYLRCKANSKSSVQQFSMDSIGKKWQALLN